MQFSSVAYRIGIVVVVVVEVMVVVGLTASRAQMSPFFAFREATLLRVCNAWMDGCMCNAMGMITSNWRDAVRRARDVISQM